MSINPNILASVPTGVPGMDTTQVHASHLPGIVIFVHGVNSDGEWFEAAEQGLIRGLNIRLGLDHAAGCDAALRPVQYLSELQANGSLNRDFKGDTFIVDDGRSPVIRFRWGYKAAGQDGTEGSLDESKVYKGKVYLNELDAWGGGPFQNGTTALPYMWGLGLDDRVFWWLYANMFPIEGREVYASPPRAYFAHAAHRLKELIKAIRAKQEDCPITLVCHSQGNMIGLAAALLGEREKALADTFILCNPPYSLESLGMDQIVNQDSKSATGQFGSVTTAARKATFRNFLEAVKTRAASTSASQPLDIVNKYLAFKDIGTGEQRFLLSGFPADPKTIPAAGIDRDNRGKVFLYCNPHDQVIGVTPVQGIGWRGVSPSQVAEIDPEGVLHQRVWAMPGGSQATPFQVGALAWTGVAYRYLADHHMPSQFWSPPAPRMQFTLSLNEDQSFISKVFTVLSAPFLIIATRLTTLRINGEPPKDWAVLVTAPALREPVTPRSSRYGREDVFDQGFDPAHDALAASEDAHKLNDGAGYDEGGQGTAETEAALRYEHVARLKLARARGAVNDDEDERAAVKRMLAENPNATDHSTILTNPVHSEKVVAYDVAIGWVNPSWIKAKDWLAFRQFANWMTLQDAKELPVFEEFVDYWQRGFFHEKQLQNTYTLAHMEANTRIEDERERSLLGYVKG